MKFTFRVYRDYVVIMERFCISLKEIDRLLYEFTFKNCDIIITSED